nr:mannose-specific lectin-like [Hydra vulgaris]
MNYSFGFLFVCLLSFSKGRIISEWSPFSNCSVSTRTRTCKPAHSCKNIPLVETISCATRCTGLQNSFKDENSTAVKRVQKVQFDAIRNIGTTLNDGLTLYPGEYLSSGNCYYAVMQGDGNFVLYVTQHWVPQNAIWASGSYNKGIAPRRVVMQNDGNLVIYDVYNRATWATGTNEQGSIPHRLVMQTDGNLVIYDGDNRPTWATGTNRG